jgi:hypothetical protein
VFLAAAISSGIDRLLYDLDLLRLPHVQVLKRDQGFCAETKIYIQKKSLLFIQALVSLELFPYTEAKLGRDKNSTTKEEQGTTDRQSRAKRNRTRRHRERISPMETPKAND